MPEFILDHGSSEAAREFNTLDAFTRGYIEAMFFTSTGTGDDAETDLEHATVAELHPDTLKSIIFECKEFQEEHATLLATAYAMREGLVGEYDEEAAGRDFWYSRNGHGAGYFDRGLGDVGDKLQEAAYQACESTLYRGDDGFLHLD